MSANVPPKRGVVAVLNDSQGRYLFIRRGLTLLRAPGFWCFPGGEVESGESWEAAVEREVKEEVGLCVSAGEKIHESVSPNGEYLLYWLRVTMKEPGQSVTLHPVEVEEARWLTPREALQLEPILAGLKLWLVARVAVNELEIRN